MQLTQLAQPTLVTQPTQSTPPPTNIADIDPTDAAGAINSNQQQHKQ